MTTKTFSFTGAFQTFVVPAGINLLTIESWGAMGGAAGGVSPIAPGKGGYAKGVFAVTPGQILHIAVGGQGKAGASNNNAGAQGWNSGAAGGKGHGTNGWGGGAGGDQSDVRYPGTAITDQLITAPGGGGGCRGHSGGAGGGPNGGAGGANDGFTAGAGATQAAPGAGGTGIVAGHAGGIGARTIGGSGAAHAATPAGHGGGGGGGGYYGGGGGAAGGSGDTVNSAGGGGGSAWVSPVATGIVYTSGVQSGNGKIVITYSAAPSAPSRTTPADNQYLDVTVAQLFSWSVNDPDSSNAQAAFTLQYQDVTSGSGVTIVSQATGVKSWSAPPNTFVSGDTYQWSVQTQDPEGNLSQFSSIGTFTGTAPPSDPVITSPANNATLTDTPTELDWTNPTGQDTYQVQRVADGGGFADLSTVYYDSGETFNSDGSTGIAQVPFSPIIRSEYIRLRTRFHSLWSNWVQIRVVLNIDPPSNPVVELFPDNARAIIVVQITNPVGGASDTVYNDVYRDDGDGEIRIATNVDPGGTWIDYTPASGVEYGYRAVAFGSSGAQASSA